MTIILNRLHVSDLAKAMPGKHTENLDKIAKIFGFPSQTALMVSLKSEEGRRQQVETNTSLLPSSLTVDEMMGKIFINHLTSIRGNEDFLSKADWQYEIENSDSTLSFEEWHMEECESFAERMSMFRLLESFVSLTLSKGELRALENRFPEEVHMLRISDGPKALGEEVWKMITLVEEAIEEGDDYIELPEGGKSVRLRGKALTVRFKEAVQRAYENLEEVPFDQAPPEDMTP